MKLTISTRMAEACRYSEIDKYIRPADFRDAERFARSGGLRTTSHFSAPLSCRSRSCVASTRGWSRGSVSSQAATKPAVGGRGVPRPPHLLVEAAAPLIGDYGRLQHPEPVLGRLWLAELPVELPPSQVADAPDARLVRPAQEPDRPLHVAVLPGPEAPDHPGSPLRGRYALLDREVSDRESADLRKVQKLLGLEDRDLDTLIAVVRSDLDATYSGGTADIADELRGYSVCFTGELTGTIDGEPISRATAQRLANERGMVIKKNVSKKLDYLVAADPHTQSGKAKKARRYDVPIIGEMEFWRKLGVEVS